MNPAALPPAASLRLSGLALGAGAAVAGLVLGQLSSEGARRAGPPCEACNGDGYIDCLCARWSHPRASSSSSSSSSASVAAPACAKCRGTLRTKCPRCRGGGTAVHTAVKVPIPVRVREHADRLLGAATIVGGMRNAGRERSPRRGGSDVAMAPRRRIRG